MTGKPELVQLCHRRSVRKVQDGIPRPSPNQSSGNATLNAVAHVTLRTKHRMCSSRALDFPFNVRGGNFQIQIHIENMYFLSLGQEAPAEGLNYFILPLVLNASISHEFLVNVKCLGSN